MADIILCGLCSSQFLLSNYQEFLEHKITKCASFRGNSCISLSQYICYHCDFQTQNADDFIQHYEKIHKLRLLKRSTANAAIQIEDYENISLQFSSNVPTNQFINFPLTFNKIEESACFSNNFNGRLTHLDTPPNNDFMKRNPSSGLVKKRDKCCIEDPNTDYCDELTRCPLLIEGGLVLPSITKDFSNNSISNPTDESITSPPSGIDHQTGMMNFPESNDFKYSCSYCKRLFKQKVHLNKHVLVKHENRRPFKCSICDYETVEKGYLKTHMRKHTGERPYACSVCDYKSSQNCALKVHMKRIHPQFMHDCNFCAEKFRTSLEHKRHEQMCSSKFTDKPLCT